MRGPSRSKPEIRPSASQDVVADEILAGWKENDHDPPGHARLKQLVADMEKSGHIPFAGTIDNKALRIAIRSGFSCHLKGLRWQTLASRGPRFSDRFAGDDPMSQNKRNEPDARRAYQVNEAAAAYRLSRWTLYKLMVIGKLRTVKIGGRRLIPVDAIEALLAGGVQSTPLRQRRRWRPAPRRRRANFRLAPPRGPAGWQARAAAIAAVRMVALIGEDSLYQGTYQGFIQNSCKTRFTALLVPQYQRLARGIPYTAPLGKSSDLSGKKIAD